MTERFSREVRAKLFVLGFTMFMVMVGFSILFPILPLFIKSELGGSARDLGVIFALYSLVQFLCSPFWGIWSDKHGRKPAIMWGLLGIFLTFILIAASSQIWHLYIARIVGGLLTSAALPSVFSYAADITSQKQRGPAIGMIGGSMAMGIVFGPAIGGFFSKFAFTIPYSEIYISNLRTPFFVGAAMGIINLFLVLIFLRENEKNHIEPHSHLGPFRRIAVAMGSNLRMYFVFALMISASFACLTSTFSLFAYQKHGVDSAHIGIIFAVFGLFGALFQGLASGVLINKYGERILIKFGVPIMAGAFLLIAYAPDWLWFAVGGCFAGIANGMLFPSIASAISKGSMVGQGGALGLFDSMEAMGRIFGPILGGYLFELRPPESWNWPYFAGALILAASIVVGTWGLKQISHKEWVEEVVKVAD